MQGVDTAVSVPVRVPARCAVACGFAPARPRRPTATPPAALAAQTAFRCGAWDRRMSRLPEAIFASPTPEPLGRRRR
jgi:hypothetical protein